MRINRNAMKRLEMLNRFMESREDEWDILIIGGGATGLGIAVDAASRGYKPILLEQHDFGSGASSRSTKLIHGGVRYLRQFNFSLVRESLSERFLLMQNAPHLVKPLPFIVPLYHWWELPYYGSGLFLYDRLAGTHGLERSRMLSKAATIDRLPAINPNGLCGGVMYYDGQFDDSRFVIHLAKTAAERGCVLLNYMKVIGLLKENDRIAGVDVRNGETEETFTIRAKTVINATGALSDTIRRMDHANLNRMIAPSQGTHLVLDRTFLPNDYALMIPNTKDGRVLFAIPWYHRTLIGTTDTPIHEVKLEPQPLEEEVRYLLSHAGRYLAKKPKPDDVISVFAGIRPLINHEDSSNTAKLSRDYSIQKSKSGLITIAGGKWTTYRKMAEDCVNQAAKAAGLPEKPCITKTLKIHGHTFDQESRDRFSVYGSDAQAIKSLIQSNEKYQEFIHPEREMTAGEVVWMVRNEMARTVEDILARRTHFLLLNAKVSIQMATKVAEIMRHELGFDEPWKANQIRAYTRLAHHYILDEWPKAHT